MNLRILCHIARGSQNPKIINQPLLVVGDGPIEQSLFSSCVFALQWERVAFFFAHFYAIRLTFIKRRGLRWAFCLHYETRFLFFLSHFSADKFIQEEQQCRQRIEQIQVINPTNLAARGNLAPIGGELTIARSNFGFFHSFSILVWQTAVDHLASGNWTNATCLLLASSTSVSKMSLFFS